MSFRFDTPTISLLVFGCLVAGLQVWWISSLLLRNRRLQKSQPLSSHQFRQDLERIFRQEP
jgi:hypothetical protein